MDTFWPYSRSTAGRDRLPRCHLSACSTRWACPAYSGRLASARRRAGSRPACSRAGRGAVRRKAPFRLSSRTGVRSLNSSRRRSATKLARRSSPPSPWTGQMRISFSVGRAQV